MEEIGQLVGRNRTSRLSVRRHEAATKLALPSLRPVGARTSSAAPVSSSSPQKFHTNSKSHFKCEYIQKFARHRIYMLQKNCKAVRVAGGQEPKRELTRSAGLKRTGARRLRGRRGRSFATSPATAHGVAFTANWEGGRATSASGTSRATATRVREMVRGSDKLQGLPKYIATRAVLECASAVRHYWSGTQNLKRALARRR